MKRTLILTSTMMLLSGAAMASDNSVKWGYEGKNSAEHWGTLSPKFKTCATGEVQSPIDIKANVTAELKALNINYNASSYFLQDTGHALKASFAAGNSFKADGRTYKLLQLHFHTPSEYSINGQKFPMVMHLVHKNDLGQLGVIGVMFKEGKENPAIKALWANIPDHAGEVVDVEAELDLKALLPKEGKYYRFMGSLTTPPCSEGVNWFVMQTPITASKAQIAAHVAKWKSNARPIQKTGNRLIVKDQ